MKVLDEIKFQASIASDYSREIHMDPDKEELTEELDHIFLKNYDIEKTNFSAIKDHVIELQNELDSQEEQEQEQEQEEEEESLKFNINLKNL